MKCMCCNAAAAAACHSHITTQQCLRGHNSSANGALLLLHAIGFVLPARPLPLQSKHSRGVGHAHTHAIGQAHLHVLSSAWYHCSGMLAAAVHADPAGDRLLLRPSGKARFICAGATQEWRVYL